MSVMGAPPLAGRTPAGLTATARYSRLPFVDHRNCATGHPCRRHTALQPAAPTTTATTTAPTTVAAATTTAAPHAVEDVLDWLVGSQGALPAPGHLKVVRAGVEGMGSGLLARAEVGAGETLLSVPLPRAISGAGEHWSFGMAAQLLRQKASGEAAPWLEALPPAPPLPWLGWSPAEVRNLQDDEALAEVEHMQWVLDKACRMLGEEFGREEVAWALAMVHSRSFITGGTHVWLPGIDCCNHSFAPNAVVRCVHSPGACQGVAAVEEVCPPSAADLEPSRFELVAGEGGIRAGEGVFISYCHHANDVFLLFFGFVPPDNPYDSAMLFGMLEEMVAFFQWWAAAAPAAPPSSGSSSSSSSGCGSSCAGGGSSSSSAQAVSQDEQWIEETVQALEAELGPREQFYRCCARGVTPPHPP